MHFSLCDSFKTVCNPLTLDYEEDLGNVGCSIIREPTNSLEKATLTALPRPW